MIRTHERITAAQHPSYAARVALTRIALVAAAALALVLASARAARAQDARPASNTHALQR